MGNVNQVVSYLALLASAAGVTLVFGIVYYLLEMAFQATGFPWYRAEVKRGIADLLEKREFARESRVASWARFGRRVCFISKPGKDWQDLSPQEAMHESVQTYFRNVDGKPVGSERQSCQKSVALLECLTASSPSFVVGEEVRKRASETIERITVQADNHPTLEDQVKYLTSDKDIESWWQWIRTHYQESYFTIPLRNLLDFAGRGTTVGLLIGFAFALISEDSFRVLATALPIAGAVLGALCYAITLRNHYSKIKA